MGYRFERKIGQRVRFWLMGDVGEIVKIERYYTIVSDGKKYLAGTPTTICPMDHC